jgi:hypothetical protein
VLELAEAIVSRRKYYQISTAEWFAKAGIEGDAAWVAKAFTRDVADKKACTTHDWSLLRRLLTWVSVPSDEG